MLQLTADRNPHCLEYILNARRQTSYEKGSIFTGKPGTIFAQSLLFCPSLPFEVKSQAHFSSVAIALCVQRGASYQNFGQDYRKLGWLAQTLRVTAFALELWNAALKTQPLSLGEMAHLRIFGLRMHA